MVDQPSAVVKSEEATPKPEDRRKKEQKPVAAPEEDPVPVDYVKEEPRQVDRSVPEPTPVARPKRSNNRVVVKEEAIQAV